MTVLLAAAAYALYLAYRSFKKPRLIELIGIAKTNGEHLSAPLTATPCLWWHYSIEQYKRSGKSSSWVKLESGSSEHPLNIDDSSGLCLVIPKGVDLTARHSRQWQRRQRHPLGGPGKNPTRVLKRLLTTNISFGKRYRFRAMAYSLAFLLAGSAATWYISARFTSGL